jgi:secreted PhoX family phosphatase
VHATAEQPLLADPHHVLDLPAGFSYRVLSRAGEPMSDGYRLPGRPDAMGVFQVGSELVLMRNHEVAPGERQSGPYAADVDAPSQAYDRAAYGGVTRMVLDADTLEHKRSELALCGTHWNCAGGLSPWGWLSCEEIFIPGHGYVFLVPHDKPGLTQAEPIRVYGRFRHEAATIDPQTSLAYLTEDRDDAAFYRFVPEDPKAPFDKGRLQALRIADKPGFDANRLTLDQHLTVDWVDIPEPDPQEDNVRQQAQAHGAARFSRTEGLWLGPDALYFCATSGGPIGRGQVLRLTHRESTQVLSLVAHSESPEVLDMPDNITVSPHGAIFIAEDGLEGNYLRRITADGRVVDFARNAKSPSEFTGPCFTPDGRTLFVNLQHDGLTLAISGPFAELVGPSAVPREAPVSPVQNDDAPPPYAGLGGIGVGLGVVGLAALMHRRRKRLGASAEP